MSKEFTELLNHVGGLAADVAKAKEGNRSAAQRVRTGCDKAKKLAAELKAAFPAKGGE